MTSAARTARSPGPALFLVIRGGHLRTTTDTRPTSVYLHDLTLRAGMHAIRHRYTTEQVSRIAKALDDAGVDEIEIAHGDGLSGCRPNYGAGAHTDPEWIEAPASVVTKAQLTTLSLPGIGTIDDLKLVHSLGVRSVRVATPATEADVSAQHISAARELGMDVSGFSDDEPHGLTDAPRRTSQADGSLRRALREHHRLGWTAGHERRTSADARLPRGPRSRAEIGIHHTRICHCTWPTPCCGRGRSCQGRRLPGRQGAGAGNTPIEAFIAVADLTGWKHNGHLLKLQDSADDIVRPLQHRPVQVDTETPTLGYSGVYSSFLRRAERAGVWSARCTGSWGCRSPRPHLLARITDRFSTVVHRRRHPTFGGSTSSRASARTT